VLPIPGSPVIQEASVEQLRHAYEVLGNSARRSTYQAWLCQAAAEEKDKGNELTYNTMKKLWRKVKQRKIMV
jgi:hypothetical protein